jgi:hypothetical protein
MMQDLTLITLSSCIFRFYIIHIYNDIIFSHHSKRRSDGHLDRRRALDDHTQRCGPLANHVTFNNYFNSKYEGIAALASGGWGCESNRIASIWRVPFPSRLQAIRFCYSARRAAGLPSQAKNEVALRIEMVVQ